jgi:hypothetical protein
MIEQSDSKGQSRFADAKVSTTREEYWAPTWENQLREARKLDSKELNRHASVSTSNRHRCMDCFCCAALTVLEERKGE